MPTLCSSRKHLFLPFGRRLSHDLERLVDDVENPHPWIEGATEALEDQLEVRSRAPQRLAAHGGEIATIERNCSRGGFDQTQKQPPESRLAATGLADEREGFTALDIEGDIRNGLNGAFAFPPGIGGTREILPEPTDFDQRTGIIHLRAPAQGSPR